MRNRGGDGVSRSCEYFERDFKREIFRILYSYWNIIREEN